MASSVGIMGVSAIAAWKSGLSITLNLDEETAQRIQLLAQERQLTVEQLVTQLVEQAAPERPGDRFARLADQYSGCSEPGWRFNREECWERVHRWR